MPPNLCPAGEITLELPGGRLVALPLLRPRFNAWTGPAPSFTFGGKPLVDHNGVAVFAELKVLRLLTEAGWNGVWISSYGGRSYLTEMPPDRAAMKSMSVEPPADQLALLGRIGASAAKGGPFDVMAWRDGRTLFFECKRTRRDRLQKSQLLWIESALEAGIDRQALNIVEWTSD